MQVNRRDFLKISGAATGSLLLPVGGALAAEARKFPLRRRIGEVPTICTYCAVGCGAIVGTQDGKVVNIEGDPNHPINRGTLCSKGMAMLQIPHNPERVTRVLYRAPGSDRWEERSWDWAISRIARRIKETRDANWTGKTAASKVVNRTEGIAFLGGSQNTNEECYLWVKAARALGLVYIEHQARI